MHQLSALFVQTDGVSRRVCVAQGVVVNVRVPVQRLRIPRLRHQRVRADEPPQGRVVVAGTVVVEGQGGVPALRDEIEMVSKRLTFGQELG